jgi:hypothetical protein
MRCDLVDDSLQNGLAFKSRLNCGLVVEKSRQEVVRRDVRVRCRVSNQETAAILLRESLNLQKIRFFPACLTNPSCFGSSSLKKAEVLAFCSSPTARLASMYLFLMSVSCSITAATLDLIRGTTTLHKCLLNVIRPQEAEAFGQKPLDGLRLRDHDAVNLQHGLKV